MSPEEVEPYVDTLIGEGWVITRTEKEAGVPAVVFKSYSSRAKLQNGLNRLAQEGYRIFSVEEEEDKLGTREEPSFRVEAWTEPVMWRVEAWRGGRLVA